MDKLTKATHEHKINLWTERIRSCRGSGIPAAKWCEENGINIKTYYYWMRKIKREAFDTISSEQVPAIRNNSLPVFSKVELVGGNNTEPAMITISINGVNIDINNGASETLIQNTLRAVRTIC